MLENPEPLEPFSDLPSIVADGLQVPVGAEDELRCHDALRNGRALLALAERAWFFIKGPDAADFLQRICSQDCKGLEAGKGAPACLLTSKGRIQAYFWIFRLDESSFIVETERAQLDAIFEILERYHFTEAIEWDLPADQALFGMAGPDAPQLFQEQPVTESVREEAGGFLVRTDELQVPLLRFFGSRDDAEALAKKLATDVTVLAGHRDYEALRIDAGFPRLKVDSDEKTMPPEIGLEAACNPEKGCYIGQEVIARLATYGHLNRKLERLVLESDECPSPGTLVYDDGMKAGRLTSSYLSPVDQRVCALAMLPVMLIEEGGELRVGAADGVLARFR